MRYTIRKKEQLANIRTGHGQWDKVAIEACFDEFDDGDGELEVDELNGAFEMLNMDPTVRSALPCPALPYPALPCPALPCFDTSWPACPVATIFFREIDADR